MNKYQKITIIILIIYPIIFFGHYIIKSISKSPFESTWNRSKDNIQPLIDLIKKFDNLKNRKILIIYNKMTTDTLIPGHISYDQFANFDHGIKYKLLPLLIDVAVPSEINGNNQYINVVHWEADLLIVAPLKINSVNQLYDYIIFHEGEKLALPKDCIYVSSSSNKKWLLYACSHQ